MMLGVSRSNLIYAGHLRPVSHRWHSGPKRLYILKRELWGVARDN